MRHLSMASDNGQLTRYQDVEYVVLPGSEDEKKRNFWDYIHIIRKRKWLFIAPLFIILPIVVMYLAIAKPIYKATSTLLIERVNPNVIAIEEVVSPERSSDSPDFFRTQYELIRSHLVLGKVVDTFQLAEPVDAVESTIIHEINTIGRFLRENLTTISTNIAFVSRFMPERKELTDEKRRQNAIEKLRGSLEIKPTQGTQLVEIVLRGSDPVSITQQVNSIAEVYMKENLENKMNASTKAVSWLTQREGELKRKISKLESELRKYKEDKKIVYLDQFEKYENPNVRRINSLQSPITAIIEEKEKLLNEINVMRKFSKKDVEDMLGALPDKLNSHSIDSLKARYTDLRTQYHNLSKKYRDKHPEIMRINSQITELGDLTHNEINRKLLSMENEYSTLISLEQAFERRLERERRNFIQFSSDIQEYNELKSQLEIDKELLLTVSKRLAETTLTEALETNNIRAVKMASFAERDKPYLKMGIAVSSIAICLSLGVGLTIMMENFDKRFRSVDEAEHYLGIAFLGIVPSYKTWRNNLVALYDPGSSASEAYRAVRTWIRLSTQDGIKTLLITSALAGEGKSQTAGNLAVAFAQLGQRVLLIDADLRRPRLHRIFDLSGLENPRGLIDVLAHGAEWKSVLRATHMENLKVLLAGGRPHNPTELLSTSRMQSLLAQARDEFDFIIVDAPVTLSIPDVAILIPEMDGVLLVHDPTKGTREVVLEAKKLLDRASAKLLGMIFNNVSDHKQIRYQHTSEYYQHTYSQIGQQRRQKKSDMPFIDMRPVKSLEREGSDA